MNYISPGLIRSLKTLGLSEYEARIYAALAMRDHAEAKELVEFLDISKPSVYESLQSLEDMGLAVIANTKPATYKAVAPEIAIKLLMDVHEKAAAEALESLRKLEKEKVAGDETDNLWSIYGKANIEYKVEAMLKGARKSVNGVLAERFLPYVERLAGKRLSIELIVFSDDAGARKRIESAFEGDGLKLEIISPSALLNSAWLDPQLKEMVAGMSLDNLLELLVDDREFLSIPPIGDTLSGLYTTNRSLITFMKLDDRFLWEGIKSLIRPPKAKKPVK